MISYLITGSNRGLGLGLVKRIIRSGQSNIIIGTYRDENRSQELLELSQKHENLHPLHLDLRDINSFKHLTSQVTSIVPNNSLNVLINNAGVSSKFTRIELVKPEQLQDAFLVNTIAPILLTKIMLPLLRKSSEINSNQPMGIKRAAVINISSILGSISNNRDGGFYPYRCSKAALNMATKSMCVDFKTNRILTVSVHPGWVKTELGGTNAPLTVDLSTDKMHQLFEQLSEKHNGLFIQFDGKILDF